MVEAVALHLTERAPKALCSEYEHRYRLPRSARCERSTAIGLSLPKTSVTAVLRPKQIEGNVFYPAMRCFISYLPCAVLAKALSSGIVPGVDVSGWWRFASEQWTGGRRVLWPALQGRLEGTAIPEPSATSRDDHRRTAMVIQQAVRKRLEEQFL